jgi:hypothetical protein
MSRNRIIALSVVGVLLLINLIVLFTYRVRQKERIADLIQTKEGLEQRLLETRNSRLARDKQLALYRSTISSVQRIHEQQWATPEQRLVPLILEVRSLAQKSKLIPKTVNYTLADDAKNKEISTIDISFGVEGTYRQVRSLIRMIEQSRQFVYIDSINLSERKGEELQLDLRLKTLFSTPRQTEGSDS